VERALAETTRTTNDPMPPASDPIPPASAPTALAARRILIVDDHPLVRRGLAALIGAEPGLVVCAEAASHQAGLDAIVASRPDLVIADISLGAGGNGLEMVKAIRKLYPRLPILMLSMHDARAFADISFAAGATGYVTKQEINEVLLIAIGRVFGGERYLSPRMRAAVDEVQQRIANR